MSPCESPHILLTGPMGSGKTTVGRLLADATGRPFFDSDVQLERRFGRTARELAGTEGVAALHRAEAEVLREAVVSPEPAVIAAAASVGDAPETADLLGGEKVLSILLIGDPAVLASRAETGGHRRPVDLDAYMELSERRRVALAAVCDLVVDVTVRSPRQVADEVLAHLDASGAAGEEH
ncbi:MAG TPA: shikimate kinase [Acidimicrobiia bacterium]|nr:shikimate kinase [Acidimicrobiia bacterium]